MSGQISQASIDNLISRVDIVEIIQTRISIRKQGKNYQAQCPFHNEKTPSFSISPEKQFYYCFGCGAHGNAISFLMHYEHLEFLDSIKQLALHAGIEIEREQGERKEPEKEALYSLMEELTRFYQKSLSSAPTAMNYLKKRGLDIKTVKKFSIGYAVLDWNHLNRMVTQKNHALFVASGMQIEKTSGKTYARFRNRVLFPIRDTRGRVVAFGGRSLKEDLPKYLNSPETPIFHKSDELYGLYEARRSQRKITKLIIVEGYMDVLSLAQQGVHYAVATLGTAINTRHIKKCLHYSSELIFCFDGDEAGRRGSWKALTITLPLLRSDIQCKFLFLPEGEDPDSLIRKIGKADFEVRIENAKPLSDVFFENLKTKYPQQSIEAKVKLAHQAIELIDTMPKGIYFQLMQKKLANLLQTNPENLISKKGKKSHAPKKISSRLNPAQLASALLLKKPTMVSLITNPSMFKKIKITGKSMLCFLIKKFQNNPTLTVGSLLTTDFNTEQSQCLMQLAAIEFPFSDDGVTAEFQGALKRLQAYGINQAVERLIAKAKNDNLTEEERETLKALFNSKAELEHSGF